uniref:Uncharacterized protein n=1 Tax=Picea glauca TaxID=3330 RepID=A0A124GNQ4_PICGL|nr:hypothetical protein ABT39_MTgene2776 [Picea glauca]
MAYKFFLETIFYGLLYYRLSIRVALLGGRGSLTLVYFVFIREGGLVLSQHEDGRF